MIELSSGFVPTSSKSRQFPITPFKVQELQETKNLSRIYSYIQSTNGKKWNARDDDISEPSIDLIEREVMESARVNLDMKTIQNTFLGSSSPDRNAINNSMLDDGWKVSKVAVASASVASIGAYTLLFQNYFVAAAVFMGIFFLASADPMEDPGFAGRFFYQAFI